MNAALPWRMRLPGFGVPYWPGRELRFEGSDDVRFPDWTVRTEVEYLRGRDAELTTPSFTPLDAYRSDAESWTLMGKLRLDIPVRAPVRALFGYRAPFLEPVTLYGGAGAGIGYQLNDRVQLSLGWRYVDFGEAKTHLYDSAGVNRGRYSIDLDANEFTASLSVWFWRLPPLLGGE